jgi:hypothetical protein
VGYLPSLLRSFNSGVGQIHASLAFNPNAEAGRAGALRQPRAQRARKESVEQEWIVALFIPPLNAGGAAAARQPYLIATTCHFGVRGNYGAAPGDWLLRVAR